MLRQGRVVLATSLTGLLVAAGLAFAQSVMPTNTLPNPYRSIENWGTLPEGRTWGSTSAVAIDIDGSSVWVAERCASPGRRRASILRNRSDATARNSIRC